jgi:hypothetical protein
VPLYVLRNANEALVRADLVTLFGTAVTVDGSGKVDYAASTADPFARILRDLIVGTAYVGIRGEAAGFALSSNPPLLLRERGGVTIRTSQFLPADTLQVVYDVTMADGAGYHVFNASDEEIDEVRPLILLHELAHAYMQATNAIPTAGEKETATGIENAMRDVMKLPRRAGHEGGVGWAKKKPPKKDESTGNITDCFVASAAFGSPVAPQVVTLRAFRDNVLRQTRTGSEWWARFFAEYAKFSPSLVQLMERDEAVRDLVRDAIVTPLLHYLELLTAFPEADPDLAGPQWAPWLQLARDRFEQFVAVVDLPDDFVGLSPEDAGRELEVLLRFVLRTPERRRIWLQDLVAQGALPLQGSSEELAAVQQNLHASGRSPVETRLIVGQVSEAQPEITACARPFISASAFGEDSLTTVDTTQWYYTVTINNQSPGRFDIIQGLYKSARVAEGSVSANVYDVKPGETIVLRMGICADMVSYIVMFIATYMENGKQVTGVVNSIPPPVEVRPNEWVLPKTPFTWQDGLARDQQRCEDSFRIEP